MHLSLPKLMLCDMAKKNWRELNHGSGLVGIWRGLRIAISVYFDTLINEDPGNYRVRIRDAKLERVMSFKNFHIYPGPFGPGSSTGLSPGDVPLTVRDISSQEIYALDRERP